VSSIVQDAVAGLGRGEGPPDERPLTDQERQMVARLLSDPFAFPQTFKAWLIAFLESSDLSLPISSIQGLGSTLGIGGSGNTSFIQGLLPAGTIIGWSSARTPTGCVRCDGSAYSRTAYARLFKEIGTTWGAGDGVNTFNVPDLRRRMPIGAGSTGYGLGSNDNRAEGSRGPEHHHYFQDTASVSVNVSGSTGGVGDHSHGYAAPDTGNLKEGTGLAWNMAWATTHGATTGAGGAHSHSFSGSGSGSAAVSGDTTGGFDQDRPAFLAIHFIITT
jgi:microcystin-dependent protein